ncbi:DUF502 domain-containing protein [Bythopirellula polymerisocia]|uniref:DUF502 domain-containing protein n=1 Tax=Bythopirellula polymerisocia TaxID=2528003 RepID=A0A5C6CYH1_9BACT|nr:DUF502 domain-containing protein [Bythopirellula polymerisocia]TWU29448.1 hypothetical protein Pla144_02260 [Bythopirellula polymerisocia]
MEPIPPQTDATIKALDPFRRAVLRGLGVLLPPLLTIVIFLWVGNTVNNYLLAPMESGTRQLLTRHFRGDIRNRKEVPENEIRDGNDVNALRPFQPMPDDRLVPSSFYDYVVELGVSPMPQTSDELIRTYVNRRFLPPYIVIPTFLCVFLLILYLLGKFLAAGVGRIFWIQIERIIHRLPLVRNVYSSVKQVTDFMFSEPRLEYTRVVAVEYPRKGVWTVAFLTGESLLDIRGAANEPVVSVLIPTSPMPFTGFTVTVKKSETIDLNITMEQAFQFIVSCGVVVPPQQLADALAARERSDHARLSNPDGL